MAVQTDPIVTVEVGMESVTRVDASVQVVEGGGDDAAMTAESLRLEGWKPPASVVAFLTRVAPVMESQLRHAAGSHYFTSLPFQPWTDEEQRSVGCVHAVALRFVQPSGEGEGAGAAPSPSTASGKPSPPVPPAATFVTRAMVTGEPMRGSCMAWNSSGTVLAVGFGRVDHGGWCTHRTAVVLLHPEGRAGDRRVDAAASGGDGDRDAVAGEGAAAPQQGSTSASALPTVTPPPSAAVSPVNRCSFTLVDGGKSSLTPVAGMELTCCITALTFHPTNPALLAGGLFTGEVVVWDVNAVESGDEGVVARSRMDDAFHRDPITAMVWVLEPTSRQWLLVTSSREGRVHTWSLANGLAHPVASMQLSATVGQGGGGAHGGWGGGGEDDDDSDDDGDGVGGGGKRGGRGGKVTGGDGGRGAGLSGSSTPLTITNMSFPLAGRQGPGSCIVGTGGGRLLRCAMPILPGAVGVAGGPAAKPGTIPGADTSMHWEPVAAAALQRLPVGDRAVVSRAVERYAREVGSAGTSTPLVTLATLYAARVDTRLLYPNPASFAFRTSIPGADASRHGTGREVDTPVTLVRCHPRSRNLALAATADGTMHLLSLLAKAPLLSLPSPSSSPGAWVVDGDWCRGRPCVFTVALSNGCAVVYDLFHSTAASTATLYPDGSWVGSDGSRVAPVATPSGSVGGVHGASGGSGRPPVFTAVCHNPARHHALATVDSDGVIRVWHLPPSLCVEQDSELAALQHFVALPATALAGGDDDDDDETTGATAAGVAREGADKGRARA